MHREMYHSDISYRGLVVSCFNKIWQGIYILQHYSNNSETFSHLSILHGRNNRAYMSRPNTDLCSETWDSLFTTIYHYGHRLLAPVVHLHTKTLCSQVAAAKTFIINQSWRIISGKDLDCAPQHVSSVMESLLAVKYRCSHSLGHI